MVLTFSHTHTHIHADTRHDGRRFMCQGLIYGIGLKLGRHVDAMGSWVVLFSLGLTTRFYVDGHVINFKSGDALVFHGGARHAVMHGVEDVIPGTAPAWCTGEWAYMRDRRISIQLRQQGQQVGRYRSFRCSPRALGAALSAPRGPRDCREH